ncbi:MAG: D-alanine--D-alanine ligase [Armatimonadetes bacterium]|nr:D-alanine--D-alanine ligase [Armatimonadota bacterium]
MSQRIRVGVMFGGRSGEHEVSLASAYSVMTHLDPARFDVVPIGIAKDGRWLAGGEAWPQLRADARIALGPSDADVPRGLLDETNAGALTRLPGGALETRPAAVLGQIDVVFPVLHGTNGEDGTMQGLLELADLPYVGPGVAASALAMDKVQSKRVLESAGIPQCDWREVRRCDLERDPERVLATCAEMGWPVFVKPANLGSSVGISKVHGPDELPAALALAARFDRRLIVEAGVPDAREIEVAVLGNDEPQASVAGEVVPCEEFYSYEAKYINPDSELMIPAPLSEAMAQRIGELAIAAYRALDLAGLSRVDFLVPRGTEEIYLNEVNTIPGFTPISMYPKLWAASGLSYDDLLARLVELAVERHRDKSRSATSI